MHKKKVQDEVIGDMHDGDVDCHGVSACETPIGQFGAENGEIIEKMNLSCENDGNGTAHTPTVSKAKPGVSDTSGSIKTSSYAYALLDVPLEAWSVRGISTLSRILGRPVIMDQVTTKMCNHGSGRLGYARVLVEMEATKDFPDKIEIVYKDSEYSWKPLICSHCVVFGHGLLNCKARPRTEEEIAMENARNVKVDGGNNKNDFNEVVARRNKSKVNVNNGGVNQKRKAGVHANKKQVYMPKVGNMNGVNGASNGSITADPPSLEKVWKVTKETVSEFKKSAHKYAVLAEESMQNEGIDPTVDSRKIVDEFVKNRRQPSLNVMCYSPAVWKKETSDCLDKNVDQLMMLGRYEVEMNKRVFGNGVWDRMGRSYRDGWATAIVSDAYYGCWSLYYAFFYTGKAIHRRNVKGNVVVVCGLSIKDFFMAGILLFLSHILSIRNGQRDAIHEITMLTAPLVTTLWTATPRFIPELYMHVAYLLFVLAVLFAAVGRLRVPVLGISIRLHLEFISIICFCFEQSVVQLMVIYLLILFFLVHLKMHTIHSITVAAQVGGNDFIITASISFFSEFVGRSVYLAIDLGTKVAGRVYEYLEDLLAFE
ncbi:hypothetical protein CTI12_AA502510 [Artemisia annua]|uniref:DUF4283 domain-containing protein n=1 Tax=Artemisia annua TaxID=35608 RepID=A0A2U1LDQ6_ARTAN|nr:hypothetical protein CTI12_AA502510 [Artemisia annua]